MLPSLDQIILLTTHYGYIFLFVISVIEGPIITVLGGFLVAQGLLNIWIVYGVLVLGDIAGDCMYYSIGRAGSKAAPLLKIIGLTPERLGALQTYFAKNGAKTLFFAKYTQTGLLALPAAGVIRMPIGKFIWYNVLGTAPKVVVLMTLGYFFGFAYEKIGSTINSASLIIGAIAVIAIVFFYLRSRPKTIKEGSPV